MKIENANKVHNKQKKDTLYIEKEFNYAKPKNKSKLDKPPVFYNVRYPTRKEFIFNATEYKFIEKFLLNKFNCIFTEKYEEQQTTEAKKFNCRGEVYV